MIRFSGVSKHFDSDIVLEHVSFDVAPGERVSLVGPGGCGKTTALKLLLGLISCDEGHTELLGMDLSRAEPRDSQAVLQRVGMAFQQGGLFDFQTVEENLTFAMRAMTQEGEEEMAEKIRLLLQNVKLPHTLDMYPHELSGGMKRRIGIARALCNDPKVAIFDEPTSGLDPVTSTIILNMIKSMAGDDSERTLLVSTSNVEIAIRFADRLILLKEGRVHADGEWRELMVSGDEWTQRFLGTRLIGLRLDYARELDLPAEFIRRHW